MSADILWITPFLMLPGIALLIVSTSSRYSALSDEIHRWLDGSHDAHIVQKAHLVKRAIYFRNALVALYISVLIFVCASLLGGVLEILNLHNNLLVLILLVSGIVVIGFAAFQLIRESYLSFEVIQAHVGTVVKENEHETNNPRH